MTSMATVQSIAGYAVKGLALLLPAAYKFWTESRKRPLVSVERGDTEVSIRTTAPRPIANLILRLQSGGAGLALPDVTIPTKEFTGCSLIVVDEHEIRLTFLRFSSHDVVQVRCAGELLVEVMDSDAVPVTGAPRRSLWVIDYAVVLVALLVIVMLVLEPAEEWLASPMSQSQDNVNHMLLDTIGRVATGCSLAAIVFGVAAFALPGRARVFRGLRSVKV